MRRMNLNALQVFAVVARHGNLQRAADDLNLSRGAVSQRIRQLETDLGVVLLVRQARGVSLTPEGDRCRAAVDAALATLETAFMGLQAAPDRITLHLGPSTATKWLMPRLDALLATFPDMQLRTEVHERVLSRRLGRGEIAIWPGDADAANPADHNRSVADIRLVAVCSPDFPRPDRPMGPETLLALPLLQDAHRRWERLIETTERPSSHNLLNFDRSALALDAAIGGHGVAIAPTYMIERDVLANRLVQIWASPQPSEARIFVSWSREYPEDRRIGRIVDWICAEFGRDPPDLAAAR